MLKTIRVVAVLLLAIGFPLVSSSQEENPYTEFRQRTYALQEAYLKRLSAHQGVVMEDLEQKLAQQKWQTTLISIMVFVMVGFGLVLSAFQFYADFRSGGRSSVSIKIGSGSFELSSTVIGIAILALSFWFFQTYIDRVYSVSVFHIPPVEFTTFGVNR